MTSRSIKPTGYFGMKDTALLLGLTMHQLRYLCKSGRIEFITSDKGTRWFDSMTVDILPKPESDKTKTSGVPEGYMSVAEVAAMFGCNIQKVYRLIKSGKIVPANFSFTKRVCIDPEGLEIDGKSGYNIAPKISTPQPNKDIFQQVESEVKILDDAFNTIKHFISSMADATDLGDEPQTIDYVKNMLMYRIQNIKVS